MPVTSHHLYLSETKWAQELQPWGTPDVTSHEVEYNLSTTTCCALWGRNEHEFIQCSGFPKIQAFVRVLHVPLYQTL